MDYTRRDFGKLVIAGVPAVGLLTSDFALANVLQAKPNSKWAGVQVGMNVPYNFGTGNYTPGDEILAKCVQLGCSGAELRAQPVELSSGRPPPWLAPRPRRHAVEAPGGKAPALAPHPRPQLTRRRQLRPAPAAEKADRVAVAAVGRN